MRKFRLSRSRKSGLGLFAPLGRDVTQMILAQVPIADRKSARLVCKDWAIFSDSFPVRKKVSEGIFSWIIENFGEALKTLPFIDFLEMQEFLLNSELSFQQKIVGLNNLPSIIFDDKPDIFPGEYFPRSIKKRDKLFESLENGSINREQWEDSQLHQLAKFFQSINEYLVQAFQLSFLKFPEQLTNHFDENLANSELSTLLKKPNASLQSSPGFSYPSPKKVSSELLFMSILGSATAITGCVFLGLSFLSFLPLGLGIATLSVSLVVLMMSVAFLLIRKRNITKAENAISKIEEETPDNQPRLA